MLGVFGKRLAVGEHSSSSVSKAALNDLIANIASGMMPSSKWKWKTFQVAC